MRFLIVVLMITCFYMRADENAPGFTWEHFFKALGEIESGNDLYAVGDVKKAPMAYRSYFYRIRRTREHVKRDLGQQFKEAYEGSPKAAFGIYQISGRYFLDAFGELPRNPFELPVQKEAVKKYMRRYAYKQTLALDKGLANLSDVRVLAGIHSSGGCGSTKSSYVERFVNLIEETKSEH